MAYQPSGLLIPRWFGRYAHRTIVDIDMTASAWNTVANHSVFVISGVVECSFDYRVVTTLGSAGAATVSIGYQGSAAAIFAATAYTSFVADASGSKMMDASNSLNGIARAGANRWNSVGYNALALSPWSGGATNWGKQGYTISTAALNAGALRAYCYWTSIDAGSVVASDGSAF